MTAGSWRWWPSGYEAVRVLAESGVGANASCQIAVPSQSSIKRVASRDLIGIDQRPWVADELVWRAAAGRSIRALSAPGAAATHNQLLEPLPHQVVALERALATNPVRLLFADEVGLGKTIEAGMVLCELKARGRVRRTLIVAPKGVQLQWVAEMQQHFGEEFALVGSGGIPVDAGIDPWTTFDQVVCSLDSIKPIGARKGWAPKKVEEYNGARFRAVVDAGWDLVVFDEAHHVSGSSEEVARHQLAAALTAATPHILLLSATPHSGKSDAFARLLGLLDSRFTHGLALNRENVSPLVVRSDKRTAKDARGQPLFHPRTTTLKVIPYAGRGIEDQLYSAITDYVRYGYQRAKSEKRPAIGFLVLLMQRLASSSTAAVLTALERRHAAIIDETTQLRLFPDGAEEWGDLTGEEQVDALHGALGAAWGNEMSEVEVLIDLARRARAQGLDAKAKGLLALLDQMAVDESDPSLKVVVFTEFTETQKMLLDMLEGVGISAVAINGAMNIRERAAVQSEFRDDARVLVSTDAGGEGINLQFAHIVVNYDLPWSPSRIEQRIGRVDRIGQKRPVRAFNLAMEHSIDARVLEVLESKLAVILAELGSDKAGDILNSADQHANDLYTAAISDESIDDAGTRFAQDTRDDTVAAAGFLDLVESAASKPTIGRGDDPNRWKELAASAYTSLTDRNVDYSVVIDELPEVCPSEPLPTIAGSHSGTFSLWDVAYGAASRQFVAVFLTDDGANRPDIADRVWDDLIAGIDVRPEPPLEPPGWDALWDAGWDYAVRADHATQETATPPGLILRLLVRVEK